MKGQSPQLFLRPLIGKVKPRKIAVFDLETTTDLEKAYLVGFYDGENFRHWDEVRKGTNGNYSKPYFPENSAGPVSQFLTWLFASDDYCKHWIYAHNGGNFDFLYVVRWLMQHGDEFSFQVVPLQSSILCLTVKDKHSKRKWTFLDSFRLMNASLEKLGQAFAGEGKVKESGNAKIDYETLHRNPLRYSYLQQDCILLHKCLTNFYQEVYTMGGDVGMTAPSTSMKLFRRVYLKKWVPTTLHFPGCNCGKT